MRHFIASRTKFCPRNKKDVTQLKTSNCILQDTICKKILQIHKKKLK